LFTLLITMEQVWIKAKTEAEKLIALARFTNQTMEALEDTYAASGVELAPNTLESLLEREGIRGVGDHSFTIHRNRIELDAFGEYCHMVFDPLARSGSSEPNHLFIEYRDQLERALEVAFHSINARIVSSEERVQNQEAWNALFQTFAGVV